jgi:hypothetical protein
MKKLFTILMLIPVLLFGQNEPNTKIDLPKNNIYGELHVGLFFQGVMNYEKQIYSGEKVCWYSRLGGGYGGILEWQGDFGWGGLGAITMLTGKKNNHFELNAGGFLGRVKLSDDDGYPFMSPIFNVGYRYQKPEGGFIFRANAGIISLGLSFGYAF